MNPSDRDRWNEEAVLMVLQPWELEVIDRGLTCLSPLAAAQPDWDHVHGQEERAMAVVGKLNQVHEFQGVRRRHRGAAPLPQGAGGVRERRLVSRA